MSGFESSAVPFVRVGNRLGLTDEQLTDDPYLASFVRRFPRAFERDPLRDVMLLIEMEPDN